MFLLRLTRSVPVLTSPAKPYLPAPLTPFYRTHRDNARATCRRELRVLPARSLNDRWKVFNGRTTHIFLRRCHSLLFPVACTYCGVTAVGHLFFHLYVVNAVNARCFVWRVISRYELHVWNSEAIFLTGGARQGRIYDIDIRVLLDSSILVMFSLETTYRVRCLLVGLIARTLRVRLWFG